MNNDKLFELIDHVNPGAYNMTTSELLAILSRRAGEPCLAVLDAFRCGFVKGQRAEKAKQAGRRSGTV